MAVLIGNGIAVLLVCGLAGICAREILQSHKTDGCGGCSGCSGNCSGCRKCSK